MRYGLICERCSMPFSAIVPQAYCSACLEESYSRMAFWRDSYTDDQNRDIDALIGTPGLTARDIRRALTEFQGPQCAICGTTTNILVIDHDHRTDFVRGLLCHECNVTLCRRAEDVLWLRQAVRYLQHNYTHHTKIRYQYAKSRK